MKSIVYKNVFVIFSCLIISLTVTAESFVEFVIADVEWPETKWGHVSLRVVQDDKDLVFDFGRYGAMWGTFDSEGAPILRVWKNAAQDHLNYLKKGGGAITEIRFEATPEQIDIILNFYENMTKGIKPYGVTKKVEYYDTKKPTFHSIRYSCTTVVVNAFNLAYPDYDVNNTKYAVVRSGMNPFFRSVAKRYAYNSKKGTWSHMWWPMDLKDLLLKEHVQKGQATQKKYQYKTSSSKSDSKPNNPGTYY